MEKDKIIQNARDLVDKIRAYSKSQTELWRRIPNLALEADGRTGFSDEYRRAYFDGYWVIKDDIGRGDSYKVFVDLSNGDLIDPFSLKREIKTKLAVDEEVINLSFYIEELDASALIERLKREAKGHYSKVYNPKEQRKWRREIRGALELSKL